MDKHVSQKNGGFWNRLLCFHESGLPIDTPSLLYVGTGQGLGTGRSQPCATLIVPPSFIPIISLVKCSTTC